MGREAALEARCCALAQLAGVYPIKLGGFVAGLPDRVFLLPGGRCWFVEFKGPKGKLRKRQVWCFTQLSNIGHEPSVIQEYTDFQNQLRKRLRHKVT